MTAVPFVWLAKDDVSVGIRWDEQHVREIVMGAQKRSPLMPPVEEYLSLHPVMSHAIVSFPAGAHEPDDVHWLNQQLMQLKRVVLILSSNETQSFPINRIKHPAMELWVQLPRPEMSYPPNTTFLTEGGNSAWTYADPTVEKKLEWMYSGQVNHPRRRAAMNAMGKCRVAPKYLNETPAFLEGLERDSYLELLGQAKFAPCPSGIASQSSFRAVEALEMGAVPILDELRDDGGGRGYWNMVMPLVRAPRIENWPNFNNQMREIQPHWERMVIDAHGGWHLQRRQYAERIARQARWLQGDDVERDPHPFCVVIPTSPIPSHPSTDIIEDTIRSVQARMPGVEILVMCDGVREEQRETKTDYLEYTRRLLLLCEQLHNVTPVVFDRFLHQAEMLRRTLRMVDTEYVMYVEHDTPIVNDLHIPDVIDLMRKHHLNVMRFHHESHVLPDHKHLMVGSSPRDGWWPTMQWSQRPHLARVDFYNGLLQEYFREDARTMIEDVMYGVLANARRNTPDRVWEHWRVGLYHPEGNIQRSDHLDGRGEQPKFENRYRYSGEGYGKAPKGAPNPDVGLLD